MDYILNKIPYVTLMMMLADAPHYVDAATEKNQKNAEFLKKVKKRAAEDKKNNKKQNNIVSFFETLNED